MFQGPPHSRINCLGINCLLSPRYPQFILQVLESCKGVPSGKQTALWVGRFRGEHETEDNLEVLYPALHASADTSNQHLCLCVFMQQSLLHYFANLSKPPILGQQLSVLLRESEEIWVCCEICQSGAKKLFLLILSSVCIWL